MELNRLYTFVVVAEEKSVTNAAKRLHTTPSSISMHIKTLEEELGVQLFIRTTRGMQITKKGSALLEKTIQTLSAVNDLVNQAAVMQASLVGEVALGINAKNEFLQIPQFVKAMSKDYPNINLRIVHESSGRILQQIIQEKLSLGFVCGPVDDSRLHSYHLQTVSLSVVMPKIWAKDTDVNNWEKLAKLPWICNDYYCPFQKIIDSHFKSLNLQYSKFVTTNDDMTKAELVASGLGMTLLKTDDVQKLSSDGLVAIVDNAEFSCDLSIVCLGYRQFDPLVQATLEHIRKAW